VEALFELVRWSTCAPPYPVLTNLQGPITFDSLTVGADLSFANGSAHGTLYDWSAQSFTNVSVDVQLVATGQVNHGAASSWDCNADHALRCVQMGSSVAGTLSGAVSAAGTNYLLGEPGSTLLSNQGTITNFDFLNYCWPSGPCS
jgi:hypothetical protein